MESAPALAAAAAATAAQHSQPSARPSDAARAAAVSAALLHTGAPSKHGLRRHVRALAHHVRRHFASDPQQRGGGGASLHRGRRDLRLVLVCLRLEWRGRPIVLWADKTLLRRGHYLYMR